MTRPGFLWIVSYKLRDAEMQAVALTLQAARGIVMDLKDMGTESTIWKCSVLLTEGLR